MFLGTWSAGKVNCLYDHLPSAWAPASSKQLYHKNPMNFWGVLIQSSLDVCGSIHPMFCCWCWVCVLPVTRQASEQMTACAHIWVCRSQAQSHGRQCRAEIWLAALHLSQVGFADSYSELIQNNYKTELILSYCGVYLNNNIVTCHEALVAVGYSTAQSGTKAVKMSWACPDMHLDRALSDSLELDTKDRIALFWYWRNPPTRSHSFLYLRKRNLSANQGPSTQQLSLSLSQQCQSRGGWCAELSSVKPSHEEMVSFATQMYF